MIDICIISLGGSVIWNQVKPAVTAAEVQMAELSANITEKVTTMIQSIELAIENADFTPNDYNPPRYTYSDNISSESVSQNSRSEVYLTSIKILSVLNIYCIDISEFYTEYNYTKEQYFLNSGMVWFINTTVCLELFMSRQMFK